MYQTLESKSGTTISLITMFLTAAAVAYADIPKDVIKIEESVVKEQNYGDLFGIDPFAHSSKSSFYNDLVKTDTAHMEPTQVVEHAIQQIKTLSFMQVDDEIDREIDSYFANKRAKKIKKILHKRQS